MKKTIRFSLVLAAVVALSGCCALCKPPCRDGGKCSSCGTMTGKICPQCSMHKGQCKCPANTAPAAAISTAVLKSLINSGTALTLVDARAGKYDDGRRIPRALNLSPDAQDSEILSMLPAKDALIVTYCANLKCPASSKLAARLAAMGYKHVLEYPKGIEGWVSEGNPVTQSSE